MSKENPLWGAPRIHGELLKLGFEVAESTVSKYMIRRRGPPSQSWRTFLRNHAEAIAAIDLCVVPTVTFERLFAFLVLGHGRRQLLWFAVTRNPSAEWLAQQMVEAFPWNTVPTYLVRDNDRAYGQAFQRRIRAMGIRDRPIAPRSPWQNPYAERLIGTLRRECLDHVLIVGERHLRRTLASYSSYYNETRTHLALEKDAPLGRAIRGCRVIIARQFFPDCTIAMRGYDFREGQGPRLRAGYTQEHNRNCGLYCGVVTPLLAATMEDAMCWEIDYKFWAEQRKAQEAKAKEEQRARVLDQVLNEANKQAEKAKVEGTTVEEVTAK
jgi:transposase InsO family protein